MSFGKGLRRTYGAAVLAERVARRRGTPKAFHEWRKYTRYYGFQLMLLKPIAPKIIGSEMRRVEKLANLLGRYHDLAVLRATARKKPGALGGNFDIAALRAAATQRQGELLAAAQQLGAEIYAEAPKTLCRRMRRLWITYHAAHRAAEAAQ